MAFMYIGIAVVVFIIIFNIADRQVNKPKTKNSQGPPRVTIDRVIQSKGKVEETELAQIKSQMIVEFEKVVESGLKKTLNDSVKKFPPEAKDVKSQMAFIRLELIKYASSVRHNPVFTEVLSGEEIQEILDKSNKKVMSEISNAFNY